MSMLKMPGTCEHRTCNDSRDFAHVTVKHFRWDTMLSLGPYTREYSKSIRPKRDQVMMEAEMWRCYTFGFADGRILQLKELKDWNPVIWQRQENEISLRTSRRNQPWQHPDFCLLIPILDSWPPKLFKRINFKHMIISYIRNRKQIQCFWQVFIVKYWI